MTLLGKLLKISAFGIVLSLLLTSDLHARDAEFDAIIEDKGASAKELLENPTIYRTVELKGLPCGMADFDFLLDRPRTAVTLAGRIHKSLDKYTIDMTKPGIYHMESEKEIVVDLEVIAKQPGKRVYYISGYWKFLMGIKLHGRMALVVEYKETDDGKGRMLDGKARGYMDVDSSVAGAAFKAAAYLFPKKVDARLNRFGVAIKKVVEGIHDDPEAMARLLETNSRVPPEEVNEFKARFLKAQP